MIGARAMVKDWKETTRIDQLVMSIDETSRDDWRPRHGERLKGDNKNRSVSDVYWRDKQGWLAPAPCWKTERKQQE